MNFCLLLLWIQQHPDHVCGTTPNYHFNNETIIKVSFHCMWCVLTCLIDHQKGKKYFSHYKEWSDNQFFERHFILYYNIHIQVYLRAEGAEVVRAALIPDRHGIDGRLGNSMIDHCSWLRDSCEMSSVSLNGLTSYSWKQKQPDPPESDCLSILIEICIDNLYFTTLNFPIPCAVTSPLQDIFKRENTIISISIVIIAWARQRRSPLNSHSAVTLHLRMIGCLLTADWK